MATETYSRASITPPATLGVSPEQHHSDLGTPELVVFNAGSFARGSILDIDPAELERHWRTACLCGLHVGQAAARAMTAAGRGTEFTEATQGENALVKPEAIAESYWHLHQEAPSAWTHELDLRPWVEKF